MATRHAVATALADVGPGEFVLVACSGGPDSLALVAAAARVSEGEGPRVRAVVVDHGLQDRSAEVAREAAAACEALGVAADIVRVEVGRDGGPEAAARHARYAALERAAVASGASVVLLGHTLEDQAETVLLRLARGSGARSLAAMAPSNGLWRRPFLDVPRATVRAAAAEVLAPLGLRPWDDPHNEDRTYARVRVRALLDGLVADLGPGVALGLTRSAELLRADADALDALADDEFGVVVDVGAAGPSADCGTLQALPDAIRTRVVRRMALSAGSPADQLGIDHVRRVDALLTDWHGQGEARLPGGVVAVRSCGRLCLHPSPGRE